MVLPVAPVSGLLQEPGAERKGGLDVCVCVCVCVLHICGTDELRDTNCCCVRESVLRGCTCFLLTSATCISVSSVRPHAFFKASCIQKRSGLSGKDELRYIGTQTEGDAEAYASWEDELKIMHAELCQVC